jgi:hypothetical protein
MCDTANGPQARPPRAITQSKPHVLSRAAQPPTESFLGELQSIISALQYLSFLVIRRLPRKVAAELVDACFSVATDALFVICNRSGLDAYTSNFNI